MDTRRAFLGTIAAAGTVSLAGCTLFEDTIEKSASPVTVPEETLTATGFEHRDTKERAFERTVDVGEESRDLRLTNFIVSYGKELADFGADGATIDLFSTPTVSVAGREANPFDRFDDRRFLREIIDRAGGSGVENLQETGTRSVSVFGGSVEFTQYDATTEIGGQQITARLHFGRTINEGDIVAFLGIHPELLDESENVYTAVENSVHPSEPPG